MWRQNWVRYQLGLGVRKHDFDACERQRHRPACDAQADQRLCYSLFDALSVLRMLIKMKCEYRMVFDYKGRTLVCVAAELG